MKTNMLEMRSTFVFRSCSWRWPGDHMGAPSALLAAALVALLAAPTRANGDVLNDFQEWFVSRGGSAPSLDLAPFPGMGTGVRAKAAVAEGEAVITAPLSMIMYEAGRAGDGGGGSKVY